MMNQVFEDKNKQAKSAKIIYGIMKTSLAIHFNLREILHTNKNVILSINDENGNFKEVELTDDGYLDAKIVAE